MDSNYEIKIFPVEPNDENGLLIMNWRNDYDTRTNSFNQEVKVWESFKEEFYKNYFKNVPLFVSINDIKIGFVSLCKANHCSDIYTIGINIDPRFRGKGLSKPILMKVIEYVKKNLNFIVIIIAEVKELNIPSIKLFTGCGFVLVDEYIKRNLCDSSSTIVKRYFYSIKSHDSGVPLDISSLAVLLSTFS